MLKVEAKATSQLVDFPIISSWYIEHSFAVCVSYNLQKKHMYILNNFLYDIHAFRTHHSFCCSYVIARRGLDTAREMESPPFSPISLMVSSKANDANAVDDIQNKKLQKTLVLSNFPSISVLHQRQPQWWMKKIELL